MLKLYDADLVDAVIEIIFTNWPIVSKVKKTLKYEFHLENINYVVALIYLLLLKAYCCMTTSTKNITHSMLFYISQIKSTIKQQLVETTH